MSSAIFPRYEKPQSCTYGGARAKKFCQGLLTAPLRDKGQNSREKIVKYYQKIIQKNLPKTIDGRARPMRLLPHRMSLPTGKAPIDPPPPSRGSQKIQLEKPLKNGDTRETKIYLSTLFYEDLLTWCIDTAEAQRS